MRYVRHFLILLFLTAASIALLVYIFDKAKEDAKDHLLSQETILAKQAEKGLKEFFRFSVSEALFIASNEHVAITDNEGKQYLVNYFASQNRNLLNVTRVSLDKKIKYSYPNTKVIGAYVGDQTHVREVFRTHKPTISSVFRTVQGYDAIAIHVPVYRSRKFDGSLAILIPFESISSRYVGDITIGTWGNAILYDDKGIILYCGDHDFVGKSMPESIFRQPNMYATNAFISKNNGRIKGIDDQEVVITYTYRIKVENVTWFVRILAPEEEALAMVSGFRLRTNLVFIFATCILATWGIMLARAYFAIHEQEDKRIAKEKILEAERESQLTRILLATAVSQSPAGIIIVEAPDGHVRLMNDAAQIRGDGTVIELGDTLKAECDQWVLEKPTGEKYTEQEVPLARSLYTGEVIKNEEVVVQIKDAEPRWLLVNSAPVIDSNGIVTAAIAVLQDITDQKKTEESLRDMNLTLEQRVNERTRQMRESMDELEAFSYAVSHDLRAPLRHLDGYSHLLIEDYNDILDGEAHLYLEGIIRSAQNMSVLIDSLLHLSRISRADIILDEIDLSELCREIHQELKSASDGREVEMVVQDSMVLTGDQDLISILMRNLISNAWKFTVNAVNPSIKISMDIEGDQRVISVEDNGAGFDMAYSNKLFTAFQRLHSQDEFPGTGIGLTTVQRIVKKHGGKVWAQGKPGEGATFSFTLPL